MNVFLVYIFNYGKISFELLKRLTLRMLAKRLFDLMMSSLGLIILLPIFIIIAFLIRVTSNGSIFFRQVRVGRYGNEFRIHKFRTMVMNADQIGEQITVGQDTRITKIGYVLRKSKFDELPQLIDVFCGSMSLVGPRPEVPEYVKLYPNDIRECIFSVRPGITDYASIIMIDENDILAKSDNPKQCYINEIMPQKLNYAIQYVQTRSFFGDLKIIFLTFGKIITR